MNKSNEAPCAHEGLSRCVRCGEELGYFEAEPQEESRPARPMLDGVNVVADPGTPLQRSIWKACEGLPYGPLPVRMTCTKCPREFVEKKRRRCHYCNCELKASPETWLNNLPIPVRIRRRVRAVAINTRRDVATGLRHFCSKRYPLWARLAFFWLALTILPISGGASTYYISTTGSDGAGGGSGTPWATFAHAAVVMIGGDTLIVRNGTYNQQILNIFTGGSGGAPTILQADNRNLAIIQPNSPLAGYAVIQIDDSYLTFDGIVADATNCIQNGSWCMANDVSGASNIVIKNGTARNGIIVDPGGFSNPNGILLGDSTDNTIQNMDIYRFCGHGIYCPRTDYIIENNRIYEWIQQSVFTAYAIQVYREGGGCNDNTVRNNVITFWQRGMVISSGSGHLVYNNIVSQCSGDGVRIYYDAVNCQFYNNTIWGCTGTGINIDGSSSGTQVKNNISFNNGTNIANAGSGTVGLSPNIGNVTSNPSFTDPVNGDFTLQLGSSAIGVGADLSAIFTTDIIGITRAVPWDAGAYRFGPSGSLPTVTTTTATSIVVPTASSGGNVTAGGTTSVTAKGVVWGASPFPTVAGNFTNDGTGTGSYTSTITGLSPGTTYYSRAYATNSSGVAYGTQLTFATDPAPGQGVTSRDLNGSSQYITMGDVIDITSASMSIVAWIKPDNYGFGDLGRIVDKRGTAGGAGYCLGFDNANLPGSMFFTSVDTSVNSLGGAVTLGVWQQVAVTYDGTNARFYVNGVLFGTPVSLTTVPTNSAVALILGGRDGDLIRLFDGMMSEVGIWSSVLTAPQIAALYVCPLDTGLIATAQGYWHLGVASPETDASGNGRTGTLVGSPPASNGPSFTCGVSGGVVPIMMILSRRRRS